MGASTRDREGTRPLPEEGRKPCDDVTSQRRLVAALCAVPGANGARARVIETHISYVLLTGGTAYKIKKAVDLGFLDFRTLAARRFYCEEELRLNRRLAPEIYIDVVAVTGAVDAPMIGGDGAILEYAVRMREFPQASLAAEALGRGELSAAHVRELAARVAAFHRTAARAPAHGRFGAPDAVLDIALANFAQLRPLARDRAERDELDALDAWTRSHHAICAAAMTQRREQGFVRECHGDLHLGNIAMLEGQPAIFDCIEFNEAMRWIDVMSEIAFTTMDLRERGRADLAHLFLDAYLEITGDFAGLRVLRFYLVYRAMVRAKIARLRARQAPVGDETGALAAQYRSYLRLAQAYARNPRGAIVIMHGLSGSGKSTVAQALLETCGAVRIRTDVERKRLHRSGPDASRVDAALYRPAATEATYRRALELAREVAGVGFVTIVDGAFLQRWQRQRVEAFAAQDGIPWVVLACRAPNAVLCRRIAQRRAEARDPSDADLTVLQHQTQTQESLTDAERGRAIEVDTTDPIDAPRAAALWRSVQALCERSPATAVPQRTRTPATLAP